MKEQLTGLQLKKDLLQSIFGPDRAAALLEQVASSVRDRDLLHNSLLQRKSKLQVGVPGHPLGTSPSVEGGGWPAFLPQRHHQLPMACPLPSSPWPQLLICTVDVMSERAF